MTAEKRKKAEGTAADSLADRAAAAAEAEELRRLSAPLVKYLREKHHPHTAIVVTAARAARMEDVMGIPFPIED